MTKKFYKSRPVQYNGVIFDSTLECQYVLFIEDHFAYYYHPFTIWYDEKNPMKIGKQSGNAKYTPDFLVRDLKENKTYLIEVKNSREKNRKQVRLKAQIARQYIAEKGHNWEYKIVTEEDFKLPSAKYNLLNEIKNSRIPTGRKRAMAFQHRKLNQNILNVQSIRKPLKGHFDYLSERDYLHFVKTGVDRNKITE